MARERLTAGIFVPSDDSDALGRIEQALHRVIAAEPLERRLQPLADEQPRLSGSSDALVKEALRCGLLNAEEAETVRAAHTARRGVIQVDDFPAKDF